MEYIENEFLKIGVEYHGAELSSIYDKKRDKELLWQADPAFWKRHAPILFPFVGNVNKGVYRYNGNEYHMTPHGFARDMEFELLEKKQDSISFILRSDDETKKNYPFEFELIVRHVIDANKIRVEWEVINTSSTEKLFYSIGGHPAFRCPIGDGERRTDYKVKFNKNSLKYVLILQDTREVDFENPRPLELKDGYLDITEHLFDEDALIFDDWQVEEVSLCTPDKKPYITVKCKGFPSFGLWSHPSTDAEYICLEPWLGRCDNKNFDGELPEKYGEQVLMPEKKQKYHYDIVVS